MQQTTGADISNIIGTSMTIQQQQAELLQKQIKELIKVGVGGKYKDTTDYTKQIQDELELEQVMQNRGVERYKKQQTTAVIKTQESTTLYGLQYQAKYISKLSALINEDIVKTMSGNSGRHRTSFKLICQCLNKLKLNEQMLKPNADNWDSISLIVLKNVINGISKNHTLNRLSIAIGSALEQEARLCMFEDKDKPLFQKVSKILNSGQGMQKQSKYLYKKNVFTYWMNRNDLTWKRWSKKDKVHLGTELIHYCEVLNLVTCQLVNKGKNKTLYYVNPTKKMLQEIKDFNNVNEAMYPEFLPMIMPPMDWDYSPFRGGYYGRKYNQENKPEEVVKSINQSKEKK